MRGLKRVLEGLAKKLGTSAFKKHENEVVGGRRTEDIRTSMFAEEFVWYDPAQ
jgi:hypothetical protein